MGRKRKPNGLMDAVAVMPWQGGVALAVIGFLFIRYGLAGWLLNTGGMLAPAFSPMLKLLAWFWLVACLLGALASFFNARKRRRLLDTRTNLESLSTGWRNFEQLVGEAFRRQGYSVDENHRPGPDGGIDLVLHKGGHRTLVQCKQWRRQQVGVAVVREMYGLLVHYNADAVKIVSTGTYTHAAEVFADGKPIELVTGEELLRMIRTAQAPPQADAKTPSAGRVETVGNRPADGVFPCPRCGAGMVERRNRRTGDVFKGCSRFPACRGTG
ncbi:restriction endonuclease [Stenotrophomonas sp. YIM B06876]|uniref:restriction endonuclease n=1 Tax=Stenotrophomonas sp. YIM B06876 TaxID=3060211 RepID=UPI002738F199|nr:restriction endonuclease [Stenotrophomonas sp. YIM B06876]